LQTQATLRTGPSDGLYELVFAGAGAASAAAGGAVGIIELASAPGGDELTLVIEAEFGYHDAKRVMGSLEVRAKRGGCRFGTGERALLRAALERFGGEPVTNLWVGQGAKELADVTVSFGSRFPFWSENIALFADALLPEDVRRLSEILTAFGVSIHSRDGSIGVPRHQLRGRMTKERQIASFEMARDGGYDAALYAAQVPCTQATRFAENGPPNDCMLDLVLSRGLTPSYKCTSVDAKAMEALLVEHLDAQFSNREWTLTHTIGTSGSERPALPERGLKWFRKETRRR
jgi:hypothetical protein